MSDRIEVQFPRKMEVEAPRTDALIDSLVAGFSALSKMLQASLVEIAATLQPLRGLPEIVVGFQKQVTSQFTALLQNQLEAQVQARLSSRLTAARQREAMLTIRDERIEELPVDSKRVTERYVKLTERSGVETANHVRQLDSHALAILERVYPDQVQRRFSHDSTPTFELVAAHVVKVADARSQILNERLEALRTAIEKILETNARFDVDFENSLVAEAPAGWYELPVIVAEIYDLDSGTVERRAKVVAQDLPPDVCARVLDWVWSARSVAVSQPIPPDLMRSLIKALRARDCADTELDRLKQSDVNLLTV